MNERHFRGNRIDNGEWVYGDRVKQCTGEVYIVTNSMNEDGKVSFEWFEVKPEKVGQSIGKTDAKGRDIYSGMKIMVDSDTNDKFTVIYYSETCEYMLHKPGSLEWKITDFEELTIVDEEDTK